MSNAFRRQIGTGYGFLKQVAVAVLVMVAICFMLLMGINQYRDYQAHKEAVRPTTDYLDLKTLTISIARYDDDELVLNQTLAKDVFTPLNASVRREFYCLTPPYPVYKTDPSDFFTIDRYRSEFITEINDYRLIEQKEVTNKVTIPVDDLVKHCLSIYEVAYYTVRMPNGTVRENAFILTSLPIPLPNENPDLIVPAKAGVVNFGETERTQNQVYRQSNMRVKETTTTNNTVVEKEKSDEKPVKDAVGDTIKNVDEKVLKPVEEGVGGVTDKLGL